MQIVRRNPAAASTLLRTISWFSLGLRDVLVLWQRSQFSGSKGASLICGPNKHVRCYWQHGVCNMLWRSSLICRCQAISLRSISADVNRGLLVVTLGKLCKLRQTAEVGSSSFSPPDRKGLLDFMWGRKLGDCSKRSHFSFPCSVRRVFFSPFFWVCMSGGGCWYRLCCNFVSCVKLRETRREAAGPDWP